MNRQKKYFIVSIFLVFSVCLQTSQNAHSETRKPARGKHVMVATDHELATRIGLDILKKGGNAVDAAVAVAYALSVVFPQAGNIGGGGFMLIRMADGRTAVIDYREKAPAKATGDMYLDENGEVVPDLSTVGYLAAGVPGTVAGISLALEKFGTMELSELLKPSVALAEKGFRVDYFLNEELKKKKDVLSKFRSTTKIFFKNNEPYEEGELLVQEDLARTLNLIANEGPDAFYRGPIAELIAKDMEANGGLITRVDMANYKPILRQPIRGTYEGYEILSMPPPSSGGIALVQLLNILEPFDLQELGFNSAAYVHLLVEAMRRVFADRAEFLGDTEFVEVPIEGLISKAYGAALRGDINMEHATLSEKIEHGDPYANEGLETTHFAVIDNDGNVVSNTYTVNSFFGSKVIVKGAGFFLNNEMDDFAIKKEVPNLYGLIGRDANAIEPNKRMLSSMTPTILLKDGKPFILIGASGGSKIITTVLQIILNVVHHGMDIQSAIDAPRVHHQWRPDVIMYGTLGLSKDTIQILKIMNHRFKVIEDPIERGRAHGILIDGETGMIYGGADSRSYGLALGY